MPQNARFYHKNAAKNSSKRNKKAPLFSQWGFAVPGVGIEPTRPHSHRILNPARLPVPPSGQFPKFFAESPPTRNGTTKVSQSLELTNHDEGIFY